MLLCKDDDGKLTFAGEADLVEMLGYVELWPGEQITIQPEAFPLQRRGWPADWESDRDGASANVGQNGAAPTWEASPRQAALAVLRSRVGMLLACLRHYASSGETAPREQAIGGITDEIALLDQEGGLDLDEVFRPLNGRPSVGYYEVSYLLFRAIAQREEEIEALDAGIAGSCLPQVGT